MGLPMTVIPRNMVLPLFSISSNKCYSLRSNTYLLLLAEDRLPFCLLGTWGIFEVIKSKTIEIKDGLDFILRFIFLKTCIPTTAIIVASPRSN